MAEIESSSVPDKVLTLDILKGSAVVPGYPVSQVRKACGTCKTFTTALINVNFLKLNLPYPGIGTGICNNCKKPQKATRPDSYKRHVVKLCKFKPASKRTGRRSLTGDSTDTLETDDSLSHMSRSPSPPEVRRSYINVRKKNIYRIHSYFPGDMPIYKFDISEDKHQFFNGHEERGITKDDVLGK